MNETCINTCGIEHRAFTNPLVHDKTSTGTSEKRDTTSCNDKHVGFLFRQCTIKHNDESVALVIS